MKVTKKLNSRVMVIAEVGSVHDGSFGNALNLVKVAAECGVDAVKFQTHISEAETLPDAPMPPYFKGEPRFEYFNRISFTVDQWLKIKSTCDQHGVMFLSSPFSEEAVHLLEDIGMERYKIPSGEVSNLPMLELIAKTNKPILLSSGMSSWKELDRAVSLIQNWHDQITVLQCTTAYPCPSEEVGLNVMLEMAQRFQLPVGLSDHTLSNYASFAAVTLGASVIEKHFTFSRQMYGSDAAHSLEPEELRDLVDGIRAIETMLTSKVDKADIRKYVGMKKIFEKSLVAAVDIPAGGKVDRADVSIKKPGSGISAARLNEFLGRRVKRDIEPGHIFCEEDFE